MVDEVKLRAQLAELKIAYQKQLPEKVAEIEVLRERLRAQWNKEDLQEFHRLVHSLTGSGATFGFDGLSATARALENELKLSKEAGRSPGETEWKRIDTGFADLCKEVHAAELAPDSVPAVSTTEVGSLQGGHTAAKGSCLYLLEDDPHLAHDLQGQLEHFGYEVRVFHDTDAIRAGLEERMPDLMLVDIMLPGGEQEGTDFVYSLRKEQDVRTPVMFLSSRGDLHARLEGVRAGGQGYFTKPVNMAALVDRIDELTLKTAPDRYRVLLVDDEAEVAEHYSEVLRDAGMDVVVVNDPMEITRPLIEFHPEIILMDVFMPGCEGPELATVIRQQEAYVGIPITFLSSEKELSKQLAAMEEGADDFLSKPISPQDLVAAVRNRVERFRVLQGYMRRDSLTGLLNHTSVKEQLDMEVSRAGRQQRTFAVAMIDIDHFKNVNDTHGHPAGDRVIKNLARLLMQRLRKTDILGRYGGEEFAVVMPDTDGSTAVVVLDKVRQAFEDIRQFGDEWEFHVTFSCGVAEYPVFGKASELIQAADSALYSAKLKGRNTIMLAQP